MLTTGDGVLRVAHEAGFAVPAFNISDFAMFSGIADLCDELKSPWIIAIHPDEYAHVGPHFMKALISRANKSSLPVAIHLDPGANYGQVLAAVQNGFTSAMIDASLKP